MALDGRYMWKFPAKDVHGREITFAVGIDEGQVIINLVPGWGAFTDPQHPEDLEQAAKTAEQAGYAMVTASYVARGVLPPPRNID
jgi:hypothetical protein